MGMRVIITGSTGMVGKGVLLECLESTDVDKVLVINRKPLGITNDKLTEIIHENFLDFSPIESQLEGYDACFLCMGVSSFLMDEEKYNTLTYIATTHIAKTITKKNSNIICVYVSGIGSDSTEIGRIMWARIKGKTENALLRMPMRAAYMFRPGYIQPKKGVRSKTTLYNILYLIMMPFYPILNLIFYRSMTTTKEVGKAMINIVLYGYDKDHLENYDIRKLSKGVDLTPDEDEEYE